MSSIHQQYQSCVYKICINIIPSHPSLTSFLLLVEGGGEGGVGGGVLCCRPCSILLSDQRLNLVPLQWKRGVPTTGQPGNSLKLPFFIPHYILRFVLVSVNLVSAHPLYFLHNIPLFEYTTMPGTSNKGTYTDITIYIKKQQQQPPLSNPHLFILRFLRFFFNFYLFI